MTFPIGGYRDRSYIPLIQFPGTRRIISAFLQDDALSPEVNEALWESSIIENVSSLLSKKLYPVDHVRPCIRDLLQNYKNAKVFNRLYCEFLEERISLCMLKMVGVGGEGRNGRCIPEIIALEDQEAIREVKEYDPEEPPALISGEKRVKPPLPLKGVLKKPSPMYGIELKYDLSVLRGPGRVARDNGLMYY